MRPLFLLKFNFKVSYTSSTAGVADDAVFLFIDEPARR